MPLHSSYVSWNWIYVSSFPPLYCCKMKISHTVFIILPYCSASTCTSQIIKECIIQSHKEWLAAPLLRLHLFKSAFMQQLGSGVISLHLSHSVQVIFEFHGVYSLPKLVMLQCCRFSFPPEGLGTPRPLPSPSHLSPLPPPDSFLSPPSSPAKKLRDTDRPKRPMNAFMLFAKKYRLELIQLHPGKDNR